MSGLYKELVWYNIKRAEIANAAGERAPVDDVKSIIKLDPSTDLDKHGMPVRGGLWDESMRRALIASADGIKKATTVIKSQTIAEVEALKTESPHTLAPITDVEIAAEQARQVNGEKP